MGSHISEKYMAFLLSFLNACRYNSYVKCILTSKEELKGDIRMSDVYDENKILEEVDGIFSKLLTDDNKLALSSKELC